VYAADAVIDPTFHLHLTPGRTLPLIVFGDFSCIDCPDTDAVA